MPPVTACAPSPDPQAAYLAYLERDRSRQHCLLAGGPRVLRPMAGPAGMGLRAAGGPAVGRHLDPAGPGAAADPDRPSAERAHPA
jgi:hypothetical protein